MLVPINSINPRIIIDVKYATSDNVVGRPVYSQAEAYAVKGMALKLDLAQRLLETQGLGLKVWDAYRPLPVQQILWDILPDVRYVADPKMGSAHNRGAAVDVTLVDSAGSELRMPTGFDDFTQKAHLGYNELSKEILNRREVLLVAMTTVGFARFDTEWWHYTDTDADRYPVLSISFEELQALQRDRGPF